MGPINPTSFEERVVKERLRESWLRYSAYASEVAKEEIGRSLASRLDTRGDGHLSHNLVHDIRSLELIRTILSCPQPGLQAIDNLRGLAFQWGGSPDESSSPEAKLRERYKKIDVNIMDCVLGIMGNLGSGVSAHLLLAELVCILIKTLFSKASNALCVQFLVSLGEGLSDLLLALLTALACHNLTKSNEDVLAECEVAANLSHLLRKLTKESKYTPTSMQEISCDEAFIALYRKPISQATWGTFVSTFRSECADRWVAHYNGLASSNADMRLTRVVVRMIYRSCALISKKYQLTPALKHEVYLAMKRMNFLPFDVNLLLISPTMSKQPGWVESSAAALAIDLGAVHIGLIKIKSTRPVTTYQCPIFNCDDCPTSMWDLAQHISKVHQLPCGERARTGQASGSSINIHHEDAIEPREDRTQAVPGHTIRPQSQNITVQAAPGHTIRPQSQNITVQANAGHTVRPQPQNITVQVNAPEIASQLGRSQAAMLRQAGQQLQTYTHHLQSYAVPVHGPQPANVNPVLVTQRAHHGNPIVQSQVLLDNINVAQMPPQGMPHFRSQLRSVANHVALQHGLGLQAGAALPADMALQLQHNISGQPPQQHQQALVSPRNSEAVLGRQGDHLALRYRDWFIQQVQNSQLDISASRRQPPQPITPHRGIVEISSEESGAPAVPSGGAPHEAQSNNIPQLDSTQHANINRAEIARSDEDGAVLGEIIMNEMDAEAASKNRNLPNNEGANVAGAQNVNRPQPATPVAAFNANGSSFNRLEVTPRTVPNTNVESKHMHRQPAKIDVYEDYQTSHRIEREPVIQPAYPQQDLATSLNQRPVYQVPSNQGVTMVTSDAPQTTQGIEELPGDAQSNLGIEEHPEDAPQAMEGVEMHSEDAPQPMEGVEIHSDDVPQTIQDNEMHSDGVPQISIKVEKHSEDAPQIAIKVEKHTEATSQDSLPVEVHFEEPHSNQGVETHFMDAPQPSLQVENHDEDAPQIGIKVERHVEDSPQTDLDVERRSEDDVPQVHQGVATHSEEVPPSLQVESNSEEVPPSLQVESHSEEVPQIHQGVATHSEEVPPSLQVESHSEEVPQIHQGVEMHYEELPQSSLDVERQSEDVPQTNLGIESHSEEVPQVSVQVDKHSEEVPQTDMDVESHPEDALQTSLQVERHDEDVPQTSLRVETHSDNEPQMSVQVDRYSEDIPQTDVDVESHSGEVLQTDLGVEKHSEDVLQTDLSVEGHSDELRHTDMDVETHSEEVLQTSLQVERQSEEATQTNMPVDEVPQISPQIERHSENSPQTDLGVESNSEEEEPQVISLGESRSEEAPQSSLQVERQSEKSPQANLAVEKHTEYVRLSPEPDSSTQVISIPDNPVTDLPKSLSPSKQSPEGPLVVQDNSQTKPFQLSSSSPELIEVSPQAESRTEVEEVIVTTSPVSDLDNDNDLSADEMVVNHAQVPSGDDGEAEVLAQSDYDIQDADNQPHANKSPTPTSHDESNKVESPRSIAHESNEDDSPKPIAHVSNEDESPKPIAHVSNEDKPSATQIHLETDHSDGEQLDLDPVSDHEMHQSDKSPRNKPQFDSGASEESVAEDYDDLLPRREPLFPSPSVVRSGFSRRYEEPAVTSMSIIPRTPSRSQETPSKSTGRLSKLTMLPEVSTPWSAPRASLPAVSKVLRTPSVNHQSADDDHESDALVHERNRPSLSLPLVSTPIASKLPSRMREPTTASSSESSPEPRTVMSQQSMPSTLKRHLTDATMPVAKRREIDSLSTPSVRKSSDTQSGLQFSDTPSRHVESSDTPPSSQLKSSDTSGHLDSSDSPSHHAEPDSPPHKKSNLDPSIEREVGKLKGVEKNEIMRILVERVIALSESNIVPIEIKRAYVRKFLVSDHPSTSLYTQLQPVIREILATDQDQQFFSTISGLGKELATRKVIQQYGNAPFKLPQLLDNPAKHIVYKALVAVIWWRHINKV